MELKDIREYEETDSALAIHTIVTLKEENKRLKELCDKYEEEHNTTFQDWVYGLREQIKTQQRIDKAIEYINKEQERLPMGWNEFNCEMEYSDEVILADKLLEILRGSNEN